MRFLPILVLVLGALIALGLSSVYIVDERQQALVLEFGKVKRVVSEPGLKFKYPAPINTVAVYEKRILPLETAALEVTPLDNRRLIVDAFARYRITDPQRFREAVQTQTAGEQRLGTILNDKLRRVLGAVNSDVILSEERASLMHRIREQAFEEAGALGVAIVDVRIRRADLPEQNLQATYDRMAAERQQEAEDERARGREAAQKRRAEADRQAVEVTSDARRQSEIVRGEADAERNRIFASAFGRDPEFFAFYRSMKAYEEALKGDSSTMVLAPNSEFFRYLNAGSAAQP